MREENCISGKSLILFSILPFVSILAMIHSVKLYLSGTTIAEQFEIDFSSVFEKSIPNESHIMGIAMKSFNDAGLFHPIFIVFICLLIVSIYMFFLIKYFKQKKHYAE